MQLPADLSYLKILFQIAFFPFCYKTCFFEIEETATKRLQIRFCNGVCRITPYFPSNFYVGVGNAIDFRLEVQGVTAVGSRLELQDRGMVCDVDIALLERKEGVVLMNNVPKSRFTFQSSDFTVINEVWQNIVV